MHNTLPCVINCGGMKPSEPPSSFLALLKHCMILMAALPAQLPGWLQAGAQLSQNANCRDMTPDE